MARLIFMGIVVIFLTSVFAYTIYDIIRNGFRDGNGGQELVLSMIGGFISALVVSVLAVTVPGDSPTSAFVTGFMQVDPENPRQISELTKKLIDTLSYVCLVVWFISGASLFVHVFLLKSDGSPSILTSYAKSWLGLAVAAAYAFFGIKPSGR